MAAHAKPALEELTANAQLILTIMQASRRVLWSNADLAKALHSKLKFATIKVNLSLLVRAGLVDSKRMVVVSRKYVAREIRPQQYFLTARSAKVKIPDTYSKTWDFIRDECARFGHCSHTQAYIATAIGRTSEGVNIAIARLRKEKRIDVAEHGQYNTITLRGEATVATIKPPPTSSGGKILKFIEDQCARTGLLSCKQATIGKAVRLDPATVSVNIGKLGTNGHIRLTPARPNLCSVPGIVGAFPGEPPVFSIEEAVLKFLRDECAGRGTCSLGYIAIAKGVGGVGYTRVSRALANLIRNGLVFVTSRGRRGGGPPSTYAAAAPDAGKGAWMYSGSSEPAPAIAPSGLSRPPKRGMKTKVKNAAFIEYWKKNKPEVLDATFTEEAAENVCPAELAKTKPYSKPRKKFLDRVGAAIRRSPEYKNRELSATN